MDYAKFLSKPRALLEAPAGYGKTYSIVECLRCCEGKQLVLTHTHAGVASLRKKIQDAKLEKNKFHLETIDGFALRMYKSYMGKEKQTLLDIEDVWKVEGKNIRFSAVELLKRSAVIRTVITNTYAGIFVDEYQDCSVSANTIIEELSNILPTRIFGDWLQAIYTFNREDPNIEYTELHQEFINNKSELDIPYRWKNTNPELGEDIKTIRKDLTLNKKIDLRSFKSAEVIKNDFAIKGLFYSLVKEYPDDSILLITPNKNMSRELARNLGYIYHVIESIDDKDFYKLSKCFDTLSLSNEFTNDFFNILENVFLKTSIIKFYKNRAFIKKTDDSNKLVSAHIQECVESISLTYSHRAVSTLMRYLNRNANFGLKDNRTELFNNLCEALTNAGDENITAYKSMVNLRDKIRHIGRHTNKRTIDSTLLTKGLEFDIVIITNADSIGNGFDQYDLRRWYVAASRAKKRLIIHSKSDVLDFN